MEIFMSTWNRSNQSGVRKIQTPEAGRSNRTDRRTRYMVLVEAASTSPNFEEHGFICTCTRPFENTTPSTYSHTKLTLIDEVKSLPMHMTQFITALLCA